MRALTRRRPRQELETLQHRMEDLFDRFTRGVFSPSWWDEPLWTAEAWTPAVESHIENGNLVVRADLPGIDPKAVSISVLGNQLKIEGERKADKEEEAYFYHELPYGKFSRALPLPEGVDADKIKADYKKGVLEITLPVPPQLVSKKIPIKIQT